MHCTLQLQLPRRGLARPPSRRGMRATGKAGGCAPAKQWTHINVSNVVSINKADTNFSCKSTVFSADDRSPTVNRTVIAVVGNNSAVKVVIRGVRFGVDKIGTRAAIQIDNKVHASVVHCVVSDRLYGAVIVSGGVINVSHTTVRDNKDQSESKIEDRRNKIKGRLCRQAAEAWCRDPSIVAAIIVLRGTAAFSDSLIYGNAGGAMHVSGGTVTLSKWNDEAPERI